MKQVRIQTIRLLEDFEMTDYLASLKLAGYPDRVIEEIAETGRAMWDQPNRRVRSVIEVQDVKKT